MRRYRVEIDSSDKSWWRVNVLIYAAATNAKGEQTDFASVNDKVCNPTGDPFKFNSKPERSPQKRTTRLECSTEDNLTLYLNVVPHTLPEHRKTPAKNRYVAHLNVWCDDKLILKEDLSVDGWGGMSRIIKL